MSLSALRRTVKFSATQPGHYWLYAGNPAAAAPRYDLTQITAATANAVPVTLGKQETNPEYQNPAMSSRPWSDRNPRLLTAIVIAAAAAMAFVAFRLLTQVKNP